MSVFYEQFLRHAHGRGSRARARTTAPVAATASSTNTSRGIETLGCRTARLPCRGGLLLFLYYYFDVGNTQAPTAAPPRWPSATRWPTQRRGGELPGRRGPGLHRPREIMQVAQMGLPISVIFVNNAIYGMPADRWPPPPCRPEDRHHPFGRGPLEGQPSRWPS